MRTRKLPRLIAIVGPTASGKSALGVALARAVGGEIISADSRQVYQGMDIGSGKITEREMKGVPHHMLDVADARHFFSVSDFKKQAERALSYMIERKKIPIVVGGSALYVNALVENQSYPEVPPNMALRRKLEKKSVSQLFSLVKKKDPTRAKTIDPKNPRRLIRALEIISALGKVPSLKPTRRYNVLKIGVQVSNGALKRSIDARLRKRFKYGMIDEVRRLHRHGVSWKQLESFGLEYRFIALYLQGKIKRGDLIPLLNRAIWDFVRRQKTWWKNDKKIVWVKKGETKKAIRLAKKFLFN